MTSMHLAVLRGSCGRDLILRTTFPLRCVPQGVPSISQKSKTTQIVASAVTVLFARFRMWTGLRDLHLANIAFPQLPVGDAAGLFPTLPALRTLYLGQATLVPVVPLAGLVCDPQMHSLTIVRLVDCYVESIWGPRLRRADLERAVLQAQCSEISLVTGGEHHDMALGRIRAVVWCEALTERIIGGDRADGIGVFE